MLARSPSITDENLLVSLEDHPFFDIALRQIIAHMRRKHKQNGLTEAELVALARNELCGLSSELSGWYEERIDFTIVIVSILVSRGVEASIARSMASTIDGLVGCDEHSYE